MLPEQPGAHGFAHFTRCRGVDVGLGPLARWLLLLGGHLVAHRILGDGSANGLGDAGDIAGLLGLERLYLPHERIRVAQAVRVGTAG